MVKKPRPARRIFGRPTEGPGPQQTFNSTFQITPAPSPARQAQFRLATTPSSDSPSPSSAAPGGPSRPARDDRRESASTSSGSNRSSLSAPTASPATRDTQLRAGDPPASCPPRRSRPVHATHRPTQSGPVPTRQAAGANFNRSRSSTAVASDIINNLHNSEAGPSSLPTRLRDGSLPARADYRGASQLAPGTPGQSYLYEADSSSFYTPSPRSGAFTGHNRLASGELYIHSADVLPWQNASPSPTPHTPSSLRSVSIPPSVVSEPSPYLGFTIGDFSPEPSTNDGEWDGEELPPLTPDHGVAALDLPRLWGRPRSHSSTQVTRHQPSALFMSARATQSSISGKCCMRPLRPPSRALTLLAFLVVPEELRGLHFPPEVFGLEEPLYVDPITPGDSELGQLQGLPVLPPSQPSLSPRPAPAPRRTPGL
ncbi:hypothetical protein C8Q77DRAFT_221451 [Trametes polyzona]|nr:hypothetical protein C8Q77DRAFT_221451 [Trametes polyzona]